MQITAIILAGGNSRRLGKSKALEPIDGKSLLECVVERVQPLTERVLIVTSRNQSSFSFGIDAEILVDLYPERGPLGGMYTGLIKSRSSHSLVVACDMPFLNVDLLRYMVKLSSGFDAVVPRLGEGRIEPLHAVYSKRCLNSMKRQLEAGKLEAYSFLNMVRVRYIELAECQSFDPGLLSFFNINRQSDLVRAVDYMKEVIRSY